MNTKNVVCRIVLKLVLKHKQIRTLLQQQNSIRTLNVCVELFVCSEETEQTRRRLPSSCRMRNWLAKVFFWRLLFSATHFTDKFCIFLNMECQNDECYSVGRFVHPYLQARRKKLSVLSLEFESSKRGEELRKTVFRGQMKPDCSGKCL